MLNQLLASSGSQWSDCSKQLLIKRLKIGLFYQILYF